MLLMAESTSLQATQISIPPETKPTRFSYTLSERAQLRKRHADRPNLSQRDLCIWFEKKFKKTITQPSVSHTLSKHFANIDDNEGILIGGDLKRRRRVAWPLVEAGLRDVVDRCLEIGQPITGDLLRLNATRLWHEIPEHRDSPVPAWSNGWLANFQRRNKIKYSRRWDAPSEADVIARVFGNDRPGSSTSSATSTPNLTSSLDLQEVGIMASEGIDPQLQQPMLDFSPRKHAHPLHPAFITSAPGKVIVYGEHAVVHGKPAIAASISLRSYLHVTTLTDTYRKITLHFQDIGLSHTWNIDELPWDTVSSLPRRNIYTDRVTALDANMVAAMRPHLAGISPGVPEDRKKVHQSATSAFLYLFLSLASKSTQGCVYTLRSNIPIGAGLGSSASISVCIASALLLQIRALSGPHQDQPPEEAEMQVERINRWAFVGEMCIHGNPSGVDNTVASGGKAVYYKRAIGADPPVVKKLNNFPELPLLLINTRHSRSTAAQVAKVAALRSKLPKVTDNVLEAISQVTDTAQSLLMSHKAASLDSKITETLGTMMNVNHGLLVALGVSHPSLERARELVDTAGIGYTKLTGAGGGGSAISLLKPGVTRSAINALGKKIDKENFEIFETTLGGHGVGVLWPAMVHEQEIDMKAFLDAQGGDGVAKLVGDGGPDAQQAWKFWNAATPKEDGAV